MDSLVVCPTRDISEAGCLLETAAPLPVGADLTIAIMDHKSGKVIEIVGTVARAVTDSHGVEHGVGVDLYKPPAEWTALVARIRGEGEPHDTPGVRLRILVIADENKQRGALALYVTSGWDIRLASDYAGAVEAMRAIDVNAVICEHELEDNAWRDIMFASRKMQPQARRLVRTHLGGRPAPNSDDHDQLFHRIVDAGAGIDALLDAVTADFG